MVKKKKSSSSPIYINFVADIYLSQVNVLIDTFIQLITQGNTEFILLLSSDGGSVTNGITLYNFLKSLPINLTIFNIGAINSIANVIFLASDKRYAVKNSSFMFHGVGFDIPQGGRLVEKDLKEKLETITNDQENIADIIISKTSFTRDEIDKMFFEQKTISPQKAKDRGIIQEIKELKIPPGARIISLFNH